MEQFTYFVQKPKSILDGDGTLLDSVMVTYGSGLGVAHDDENMATVIAGGGFKSFNFGKRYRYLDETPIANLPLTMLQYLGVTTEAFADSTGPLQAI
jgi:hypothetical protein